MIQLNLSAPPSVGPDFFYLASAGGPVLDKAMHQQFGKKLFLFLNLVVVTYSIYLEQFSSNFIV